MLIDIQLRCVSYLPKVQKQCSGHSKTPTAIPYKSTHDQKPQYLARYAFKDPINPSSPFLRRS